MQRRSFLGSILALGVAPAIVRPESLMKIAPRQIWTPPAGIYTQALEQASSMLRSGGVLRFYTSGGLLLATIPLENMVDSSGVNHTMQGAGTVIGTGRADHAEIDLPGGLRHKAQVGHGGLQLNNEYLCPGQTLSIDGLRFTS